MEDVVIGILLIIGFVVALALVMTIPVMLLWNWLMPIIFGLTTITFWQALGLSLLSSMLFKNNTSFRSNKGS